MLLFVIIVNLLGFKIKELIPLLSLLMSRGAQQPESPIEPDVEPQPPLQQEAEGEPLDPEAAPEPPHAHEVILVPSDGEEDEPMQQNQDSSPESEAFVARRGRVDPTHCAAY
jgi:hypothetical protein